MLRAPWGNYAFNRAIRDDLGLTDPVFQRRLDERGIDPDEQPEDTGTMWIDNVWHGRAWSREAVRASENW